MSKPNIHSTFVTKGIDRVALVDQGVRKTMADPELVYLVHDHKYAPYQGTSDCVETCIQIIRGETSPVLANDNVPADA